MQLSTHTHGLAHTHTHTYTHTHTRLHSNFSLSDMSELYNPQTIVSYGKMWKFEKSTEITSNVSLTQTKMF